MKPHCLSPDGPVIMPAIIMEQRVACHAASEALRGTVALKDDRCHLRRDTAASRVARLGMTIAIPTT